MRKVESQNLYNSKTRALINKNNYNKNINAVKSLLAFLRVESSGGPPFSEVYSGTYTSSEIKVFEDT